MTENQYPDNPQPHDPSRSGSGAEFPAEPPAAADPWSAPTTQPTQSYPSTNSYPPPTGGYGSQTASYPSQTSPYGPPTSGYAPYYDQAGATGYPPPVGGPEQPAGRPARRGRGLLVTAIVAALVGGGVGAATVAIADRHNNSVNTGLKITNSTGAPAAQLDGTVSAAAAKIRPSVVTLNVTGSQGSGTGSGVIIRDDGYILTNDHVVSIGAGGGSIEVTLSDGRQAKATIVGRDNSDDLAVVKVTGLDKLAAATFAKSSSLTVGQSVVAVGAPLGLSDTVTSGIVSNVARPVRAGDNDQAVFEAVQTDAAINPGNSGGPLVDLNGSVVGINAAIASDSSGGGLQIPGQTQQSGNIGIGFAIPADEASRIAGELIATGKATHAVLNVSVGGSSSATTTSGVPLSDVTGGGAAADAGLQKGDVITAIDGQRVVSSDALIAAVRSHAPGDKVSVSYTRAGKASTATVTLASSDS